MTAHVLSRFQEARIIQIDPALCTQHPANRRDLTHAADHVAGLKTSILAAGQLVPAVVLATAENDQMFTIFGACRAEAIRQLRAEGHEIHLSALLVEGDTTLGALMITAEQTRTQNWSQWERAELFDRLAADMSNAQIARQFELAKSTIGRTRNVTALPSQFLQLVADRHAIEAEPARLFNNAWASPQRLLLARHLAELLIQGEKIDAPALFDSCAEALALAGANAAAELDVVAGDTAEAVSAALTHLQSVVRDQRGDEADDNYEADDTDQDDDNDDADVRRAARVERKLEAGPRIIDIVLDDEEGDIIGEAKRTPTGALIITVEAVDQYPVDTVGAAITAALVRLFVN